MAADGEIVINTKIDQSGIEKGTQEIDSKLKESASGIEKLSKGTAGAVAAISLKATKEILKNIRDVTEAYKVQSKAEKALETAAKNNKFLNGEAVEELKKFASELQNVTNYGDEFTLQFMTQLAAAGRTQDEIQRIIKASANVAASGSMSFESSVRNLNKTFSGLAGELGESVPAIRNLTQEELKQGKAIDVLQKQYEGMAESVVDVRVQMQNAQGDLKEAIGELTAPAANAWDAFWLNFYNKGIEVINGINDKIDQMTFNRDIVPEVEEVALGGQANTLTDAALEGTLAYYEEIEKKSINITAEQKAQMRLRLSEKQLQGYMLTSEQELVYKMLKREKEKREELKKKQEEQTKAAEEQAAAQEKVNEAVAKEKSLDEQAAALKSGSKSSLDAQLKAIELKATLIENEAKEQDKLNAMIESYVSLIANSNGLITENNATAKERIKQIDEQQKKVDEEKAKRAAKLKELEEQAKKEEKQAAVDTLGKDDSPLALYQQQQAELKALRDYWQQVEIDDEEKRKENLAKIDEEIAQNKREHADEVANEIIDYTNRINNIMQQAAQVNKQISKASNDSELADLEAKRRKGEISEKEYEEKKVEIRKKGAKEQYKIDMAAWLSSLLVATANIAQGVTKAIAQGFPIGLINGSILAAAGGVQLASIIGAKPQPPKFAEGGIVGGNSYTGDNIEARVNSGEMVLTRSQQKALFNLANGKKAGAAGAQIVINNNASNMVTATAQQLDTNKIGIMIDAHINEGLQSGKFTNSLQIAQAASQGNYLGI